MHRLHLLFLIIIETLLTLRELALFGGAEDEEDFQKSQLPNPLCFPMEPGPVTLVADLHILSPRNGGFKLAGTL